MTQVAPNVPSSPSWRYTIRCPSVHSMKAHLWVYQVRAVKQQEDADQVQPLQIHMSAAGDSGNAGDDADPAQY